MEDTHRDCTEFNPGKQASITVASMITATSRK